MIVVSHEIGLVDEEIVVSVELPELAVDHVKVLVAEISGNLIDVLLVFQNSNDRQQIAPSELRNGYLAAPAAIHAVEYPRYYLHRKQRPALFFAS